VKTGEFFSDVSIEFTGVSPIEEKPVIIDASNLHLNIAAKVLISKIDVCCTKSGCSWTGQHSKKERHRDTCPIMLVECINNCIRN